VKRRRSLGSSKMIWRCSELNICSARRSMAYMPTSELSCGASRRSKERGSSSVRGSSRCASLLSGPLVCNAGKVRIEVAEVS